MTPDESVIAANCPGYAPRGDTKDSGAVRLCAAAPVAVDGWQPIETAPEDGTEVLLANRRIDIGWWTAEEGWSNEYELLFPTHWMPLPPPPAAAP